MPVARICTRKFDTISGRFAYNLFAYKKDELGHRHQKNGPDGHLEMRQNCKMYYLPANPSGLDRIDSPKLVARWAKDAVRTEIYYGKNRQKGDVRTVELTLSWHAEDNVSEKDILDFSVKLACQTFPGHGVLLDVHLDCAARHVHMIACSVREIEAKPLDKLTDRLLAKIYPEKRYGGKKFTFNFDYVRSLNEYLARESEKRGWRTVSLNVLRTGKSKHLDEELVDQIRDAVLTIAASSSNIFAFREALRTQNLDIVFENEYSERITEICCITDSWFAARGEKEQSITADYEEEDAAADNAYEIIWSQSLDKFGLTHEEIMAELEKGSKKTDEGPRRELVRSWDTDQSNRQKNKQNRLICQALSGAIDLSSEEIQDEILRIALRRKRQLEEEEQREEEFRRRRMRHLEWLRRRKIRALLWDEENHRRRSTMELFLILVYGLFGGSLDAFLPHDFYDREAEFKFGGVNKEIQAIFDSLYYEDKWNIDAGSPLTADELLRASEVNINYLSDRISWIEAQIIEKPNDFKTLELKRTLEGLKKEYEAEVRHNANFAALSRSSYRRERQMDEDLLIKSLVLYENDALRETMKKELDERRRFIYQSSTYETMREKMLKSKATEVKEVETGETAPERSTPETKHSSLDAKIKEAEDRRGYQAGLAPKKDRER